MPIRDNDPEPRDDDDATDLPVDNGGDDDQDDGGAQAAADDDQDDAVDDDQDDAVDDEPVVDDEPPPRRRQQPTKDENMAALRARERAAAERADRAERALADSQRAAQPVHQGETPQARHARLAAMTPEDRLLTIAAEAQENLHRTTALANFRVADSQDQAEFGDLCRSRPQYKRYAEQVEAALLESRRQGTNYPRATILKFILGDRVLANQPKAKKQQAAADVEARRQKGNPERPKGDQGGGKSRMSDSQAREKRLLNQRI